MSTGSEAEEAPPSPQLAILQTWEAEADDLNLQGDQRALFSILRGFHQFSLAQCQTLRDEGYSTLSHLYNWRHDSVRKLLETISNRPVTRGGRHFGDRKIKELQAFAWYLSLIHI